MRIGTGLLVLLVASGCLSGPQATNQDTISPGDAKPPEPSPTVVRPGTTLLLRTDNLTEFRLRFPENAEVAGWTSNFLNHTGIALWYPLGGLLYERPCVPADEALFVHGAGLNHPWSISGRVIPAGDYRALVGGSEGAFLRVGFLGDGDGEEIRAAGIPAPTDAVQGWPVEDWEETPAPYSATFLEELRAPPHSLIVGWMQVFGLVSGPVSRRTLSLSTSEGSACTEFEAAQVPSVWTPVVGSPDYEATLAAVVREGGNFTIEGRFETPAALQERHDAVYWVVRL